MIDCERLSFRAIDGRRQNVRLGCQGLENLFGGGLVLERQRRCTVGSHHVRQRIEILHLHLPEEVHPVFGKRDTGHAQSRKRVDHDQVCDLAANRKFAVPLHVNRFRSFPFP